MNLQSIIVTNCIGIAMLVVLQISSYLVRQRKLPSDRIFTAMIFLTAAACATETISFIVDGKSFFGARAAAYITNSLSYTINVTVSYLWCIYVDLRLYKQESRLKNVLFPAFPAHYPPRSCTDTEFKMGDTSSVSTPPMSTTASPWDISITSRCSCIWASASACGTDTTRAPQRPDFSPSGCSCCPL